jgi:hypothetical protein
MIHLFRFVWFSSLHKIAYFFAPMILPDISALFRLVGKMMNVQGITDADRIRYIRMFLWSQWTCSAIAWMWGALWTSPAWMWHFGLLLLPLWFLYWTHGLQDLEHWSSFQLDGCGLILIVWILVSWNFLVDEWLPPPAQQLLGQLFFPRVQRNDRFLN